MLKLAIIRVNDTTGEQEVLLDVPLAESLADELHRRHLPGFRKRNVRRALEALDAAEAQIKQQTTKLP